LIDLKLHHIGCAVESIESSLQTYKKLFGFGEISEIYTLEDIGIRAGFVELGRGIYLELIEPIRQDSPVKSYLKKGITYYHLGYKVKNVDKVIEELLENNFKFVVSLYSPAFENRKCAFLYTPELQMIELIDSD